MVTGCAAHKSKSEKSGGGAIDLRWFHYDVRICVPSQPTESRCCVYKCRDTRMQKRQFSWQAVSLLEYRSEASPDSSNQRNCCILDSSSLDLSSPYQVPVLRASAVPSTVNLCGAYGRLETFNALALDVETNDGRLLFTSMTKQSSPSIKERRVQPSPVAGGASPSSCRLMLSDLCTGSTDMDDAPVNRSFDSLLSWFGSHSP